MQTCISPDYVYVDAEVRDSFIAELKKTLLAFYGEDPKASSELSRIINENHTRRLAALLQDDECVFGARVTHCLQDVCYHCCVLWPCTVVLGPGTAAVRFDFVHAQPDAVVFFPARGLLWLPLF